MSSMSVLRDLAEFFLPVGWVGGVIAAICALVAGVALARGSAAFAGGSVAVWIGAALASVASGFAGQWIPAIIAGGSLVAALVLGLVARGVISLIAARPRVEAAEVVETVEAPAAPAVPAAVAAAAPSRLTERFGVDVRPEPRRA